MLCKRKVPSVLKGLFIGDTWTADNSCYAVLAQKLRLISKSWTYGYYQTKRMCIRMKKPTEFKWKHYEPEIILQIVQGGGYPGKFYGMYRFAL